jgi:hypothetical protein
VRVNGEPKADEENRKDHHNHKEGPIDRTAIVTHRRLSLLGLNVLFERQLEVGRQAAIVTSAAGPLFLSPP